jgi:hypothetical protein
MANRNSPTAGRAHQERRASARRGAGIAPATLNTCFAERGCDHTTGGLRPPLLVVLQYGHSPAKLRLVRCTNARLQERRASARRGAGNNRRAVRIEDCPATGEPAIKSGGCHPAVGNSVEPWMANRNSPTAGRAHQERRASARRGNETHLQWREFFPERVRSRTTGGLRPPLLVACADVIADIRFAPTSTHLFPRGAYVSRSGARRRSTEK